MGPERRESAVSGLQFQKPFHLSRSLPTSAATSMVYLPPPKRGSATYTRTSSHSPAHILTRTFVRAYAHTSRRACAHRALFWPFGQLHFVPLPHDSRMRPPSPSRRFQGPWAPNKKGDRLARDGGTRTDTADVCTQSVHTALDEMPPRAYRQTRMRTEREREREASSVFTATAADCSLFVGTGPTQLTVDLTLAPFRPRARARLRGCVGQVPWARSVCLMPC
eukprot:6182576-Pleurochrysis_carterae.AAC.1